MNKKAPKDLIMWEALENTDYGDRRSMGELCFILS